MESKTNEQAKIMGKLISRCWMDEVFKQRFITDPAAVMREAGLSLPSGVEIKVVENTVKINYVLLPGRPTELSDEQLDAVAGGDRALSPWLTSIYTESSCDCDY